MENLPRNRPRGGKREGAGRKSLPASKRPRAVTVRIAPSLAARFADYCTARGLSQSEAFAGWVARLKATPKK